MEIKNIKFEIYSCISILTLCLAFFALVSVCIADEFEPLDVLDANSPVAVDMNAVSADFLNVAQASLLTKMDSPSDLQSELKRVINQLNSVQFKSKQQAEQDAAVSSDIAAAKNAEQQTKEPNESPKAAAPETSAVQSGQTGPNITAQTAKIIEQSIQQPQNVKNPLELAELLYNCGRLKDAAAFYQQALNDANDANNIMYKDRAWILFQIGNCLQKIEPETAAKMYRRLMAEHSDSIWAQPAVAKLNLIEWYTQQKPQTLLQKTKKSL
jgi:tetratricopeptide (TPR) repeat protein